MIAFSDGAETGRIFDVFLSYAREDVGQLAAAITFLEKRGYSVDWDKRLVAGQLWKPQLHQMIKRARKVVALWSNAASKSEYVSHEMSIAFADNKLVPLRVDDTPVGNVFKDLQHLRVSDFETEAAAFLEALGIEPTGDKPAASLPSKLSADDIWLEGLPTGTPRLFGRDVELSTLLAAWASGGAGADAARKTNAVVLHAIGGAGKSALLRRFLDELEAKGFPGAAKVYGWSAYSQGSGDNRNADADGFISRALKFFGHDLAKEPITDPVERGRTLARLVRRQRTLLVLDGLEPLQDLPHVNEGRLKDRGLQALVTQLARENPGLVVITSRQELPELAAMARPTVINHELNSLNERAGAELLKHLGVLGRERELMAAVREVGGHALSVSLLGTYLSAVCAGDVARRDTLRFHDLVDAQGESAHDRQARRANRIMDAYVERFEQLTKGEAKGEGDPERLILSLVGLFDRPAEPDALAAVLAAPPIPGLTDGWHALSEMQQKLRWTFALKRLRALKLVAAEGDSAARPAARTSPPPRGEGMGVGGANRGNPSSFTPPLTPPHQGEGDPLAQAASGIATLDAHPVVRQHFGRRLKEDAPDAFREANRRLYEHYKALPQKLWGKDLPDTLEEMQPLFLAIAHGCAAGLHQEVFDEVYWERIIRSDSEAFINHSLGAFSAFLGTLAHFFESPWLRPAQTLSPSSREFLLDHAGFGLNALSRLREALSPIRVCIDISIERTNWERAASNAGKLGELLLTLGHVGEAITAKRRAVEYADQSRDAFWRVAVRTRLADALHQSGDIRAAGDLFVEAERLKNEGESEYTFFSSLSGHLFCDLLLGKGRYDEVMERASYGLDIAKQNIWLLDIAAHTLSFGRAAHQVWQASLGDRERARSYLDAAVEGFRKAGDEAHIPCGLLARAAFRRDTGDLDGAQEDLAETHEIASRGGMRLFLADYHLERARLLLAQIPSVTPPDEWTLALSRNAATAPPGVAAAEPPKGWWARMTSGRGNAKPARTADPPASTPPTLTAAHRHLVGEADKAWTEAHALIQATGYHRRDGELAALRTTLDALAG